MSLSNQEITDTILQVSKQAACTFQVAQHDRNDVQSLAAVLCLEALPRYDHHRSLGSFLWIHVRNRIFNYTRDHYGTEKKRLVNVPQQLSSEEHARYYTIVDTGESLSLLLKKVPRKYRESFIRIVNGCRLKTHMKYSFVKYLYDGGFVDRLCQEVAL